MSFSSFGPFCLICKRKPAEETCSSTVQYLFLEHYNNYYILARYLGVSKPKPIPVWYDKQIDIHKQNGSLESLRFTYGMITDIIMEIADDYREAIRRANLLVVKEQSDYFARRFPFLQMHLIERPLTFVHTDWFARYYWDEYENETQDIEKKFFDDFTVYDNNDLINDLNI